MTADRLPKILRTREAVARAADPCLMPVGLGELCWLPGDHGGACGRPLADLVCHLCDGTGYFTETLEGANGRDEDVDYRCGLCDGSGVES